MITFLALMSSPASSSMVVASTSPTGALAVLRSGFVLVGNVPAPDGKTVVPPGSLLVINPQGGLVTQLVSAALLDGPWDMTVIDRGQRVTAQAHGHRAGMPGQAGHRTAHTGGPRNGRDHAQRQVLVQ